MHPRIIHSKHRVSFPGQFGGDGVIFVVGNDQRNLRFVKDVIHSRIRQRRFEMYAYLPGLQEPDRRYRYCYVVIEQKRHRPFSFFVLGYESVRHTIS